MSQALEQLSGKLGIDVTDFKTGVREADREMRRLESGFKASTATLGDWSKSASGLEERIVSLTSKVDIQRAKVAAVREEYERVKQETGENSRATKEAEIALNKQVQTLGEMEKELGESEQALQELSTAEDEAGNSADEASGKMDGFKNVIGGIGAVVSGTIAVVAALAAAVVAVTVAIGGLVFATANSSAELVDLSTKTGISTTRLQELDYIAGQLGTTQETITGSFRKLTISMSGAQEQYEDYNAAQAEAQANGEEFNGQLGDSAAAFEQLGVSVLTSTGELRDRQEVFDETITALGMISNEAERDALALRIFGKSAMELNPLIKAGAGEMANLAEQAHRVGAIMSEEDVAAMEAFDDTLASLQASLKGTLGTLAAAFLPGFQMVFDQLGGYLTEFSDIVRGADGDFGKIADGVGGLLGKIISDVATQAPQMLQAGLGILQSIIDAIVTNLPTLVTAAIDIVMSLLDFIILNLPVLIQAGLDIIIALVTGIAQALPTLIPAIVQAILLIVTTLIQNLPLLIDAALQLILALVQGILMALPVLIAAMPQLIAAILTAILESLPLIGLAAIQLIFALAYGILANIPVVVVAIGELILAVGNALLEFIKRTPERGKEIIQGLVNGLKSSQGMLYTAITNIINGMIARIKDLLDMHSPSGVGEDIGENLFDSVGSGGVRSAKQMRKMLTQQMLGLTNDLTQAASPTSAEAGIGVAGGGSASSSISIGDIIISVAGTNLTAPQIATATKNGVLDAMRSKGIG